MLLFFFLGGGALPVYAWPRGWPFSFFNNMFILGGGYYMYIRGLGLTIFFF